MNFLVNVLARRDPQEVTNGTKAFLGEASKLFTWVMTNLGVVVKTVTSNPLMMIGFLILLVGLCIGIFKRLVNVS